MGVRQEVCTILTCDECGASPESDGGTIHYSSEEEARQEAQEYHEWIFEDGKDICEECQDEPNQGAFSLNDSPLASGGAVVHLPFGGDGQDVPT